MIKREQRRLLGVLQARLPEVGTRRVTDPRRAKSVRQPLGPILDTILVGMVAGVRSLAELERFTELLGPGARAALGLRGRLPDTTVGNVLVDLEPEEIIPGLHRLIRSAHHRKAITHEHLPPGIVSMDGKCVTLPAWDERYAQRQTHSNGGRAHGALRTVTSCLLSSSASPCIDVFPVPANTNEMRAFRAALDHLLAAYASLDMVRTVLYDAGACSKDNADYTREKNVHYRFVLFEGQPTLLAEARRHHAACSKPEADDVTEEVRAGGLWRRSVYVETIEDGWMDWDHLRTCVRFVSERLDKDGNVTSTDERYYISSLPADRFLASRWNLLLRRRWAVENECHHTFDTVFAEDDRRWIETDPVGALVIVILRRIAYSMLAFYRALTLRSEERRYPSWKDLLTRIFVALMAATTDVVLGLRPRRVTAAPTP